MHPPGHRKGRRRNGGVLLAVCLLVALAGGGGYFLLGHAFGTAAPRTSEASPVLTAQQSVNPEAAPSPTPTPSPTPATVIQQGDGTYAYASGGTGRVGKGGKLERYKVAVENGSGADANGFARQVDAILDNTSQGWSAQGLWDFQRVSSGSADFTIYLVSPKTAITKCWDLIHQSVDEYGGVSCSNNGDTVVINMNRWIKLTSYYTGQPDLYHALAINHEVGHSLGHGHASCPGKGDPAPVMMQQIKGLHGCVVNGWPYSTSGTYITGPPTL